MNGGALALALFALTWPRAECGAHHPADEGYAELEYAPERGALELALRVDGLTLDRALSLWIGREVKLEDPKGEVALVGYLREGLRLERCRAIPGEPRWIPLELDLVGWEFEGTEAWIYAEFDAPAEPADLRASFELFFDLFTTQVNELVTWSPSGSGRHVFRWHSEWADLTPLLRPPAAR